MKNPDAEAWKRSRQSRQGPDDWSVVSTVSVRVRWRWICLGWSAVSTPLVDKGRYLPVLSHPMISVGTMSVTLPPDDDRADVMTGEVVNHDPARAGVAGYLPRVQRPPWRACPGPPSIPSSASSMPSSMSTPQHRPRLPHRSAPMGALADPLGCSGIPHSSLIGDSAACRGRARTPRGLPPCTRLLA